MRWRRDGKCQGTVKAFWAQIKSQTSGSERSQALLRHDVHSASKCFSAESGVWLFSTTWQISPEASSQRLNRGLIYEFVLYHRGEYKRHNKSGMNLTDITDGNLIGLRETWNEDDVKVEKKMNWRYIKLVKLPFIQENIYSVLHRVSHQENHDGSRWNTPETPDIKQHSLPWDRTKNHLFPIKTRHE